MSSIFSTIQNGRIIITINENPSISIDPISFLKSVNDETKQMENITKSDVFSTRLKKIFEKTNVIVYENNKKQIEIRLVTDTSSDRSNNDVEKYAYALVYTTTTECFAVLLRYEFHEILYTCIENQMKNFFSSTNQEMKTNQTSNQIEIVQNK